MLKGSYSLVLNEEKLNVLEKIAKEAYTAVMSTHFYQVSTTSPILNTIHLPTDLGKIQNKRPGVYIIQNKQTGYCIVGQTKDLRKRFNQYTSRSKMTSLETTNNLNRNFYLAAQQISQDIDYSQVFQRYVVYTWVDENKQPLKIDKSLELKNEMSYLEHRLILAFFESGLAYNLKGVSPYLSLIETDSLSQETQKIVSEKRPEAKQTGHQPKAFKINGYYFESSAQYVKYRQNLDVNTKKDFLSMPTLRKKLANDSSSKIRYLTKQEIENCLITNLFSKPTIT